jgi:hypothetical protein
MTREEKSRQRDLVCKPKRKRRKPGAFTRALEEVLANKRKFVVDTPAEVDPKTARNRRRRGKPVVPRAATK